MSITLYHLLQKTASQFGERPAVKFGEDVINYRQLLDRSDRTASMLAELGAGPGRRVAFSFNKSIDAIVALFALIRTGATYVPLDPTWPAERCAMICEDADISLWVGTSAPVGIDRIKTVVTSRADEGVIPLSQATQHKPATISALTPKRDVANILFTSGSTGRPKGVEITTESLLHFSKWVVDEFGVVETDRVANHAPYNFDLSTLDIFAAVRAGALMIPVPERLKMFPYQMAKFIAAERITVWYSVPSALIMMQLRGKLAEHDLSALRLVFFAGEVMPKPALQAIAKEILHAVYANLYGPTETNACTYRRVSSEDLKTESPLPIGRAIADTRLWFLDESGSAHPFGSDAVQSGELLVAGPTVTAGYHGDAELTSQRLIPSPDGHGLAYRTGDRVHIGPDGELMFDGRVDRMIKCRGHRIEPGEIEAALASHASVQEAAVIPLPDPVFGNRIKACIAPREGVSLTESDLIAHCRDRLPSYMLPDVWQFYRSLPRTDREKVNLQALAQ